MDHNKKKQIIIFLGDFNAKIGQGIVNELVGQVELGVRNERGTDTLIAFCQEHQLIVRNTLFTQVLYLEIKTNPRAHVRSDHNLLLAEMHKRVNQ